MTWGGVNSDRIWAIRLTLCHVSIIQLFHSILMSCNQTHTCTHLFLWSESPPWPSSTHTLSCDLVGSLPLLPFAAWVCVCAAVTSLSNVRAGPHPQCVCVCECVSSVASLTNVCPGPHPSHPSGPAHCFDV